MGPCLPNPARGTAYFNYQIPAAGRVSLRVYDICGRLVRKLADLDQPPGRYRLAWDGTDDLGRAVASGVYFHRLEAGGASLTGKLTFIH
jgi:flagellar hook assembly protein FlgD